MKEISNLVKVIFILSFIEGVGFFKVFDMVSKFKQYYSIY